MSQNSTKERDLQMKKALKITELCKSNSFFNNLMTKILDFFEEKKFCDVTLVSEIDNFKIDAHKMVLSAASDYFLAMFSGAMKESKEKEVKIHVDGQSLKSVITYIYTSTIELTTDSVEDVLKAASFFEMAPLKTLCCEFISKQVDTSNCLGIALFAEQYSLEQLYKESESYVCENFAVVCKDEEFFKLDVFQLSKFLSSSQLLVDSEEDVFRSLISWINYEKPNREEYLGKLLHHVRFSLLTPKFIASAIEPVCNSIDCERLISKAYKWHLLPEYRLSLYSEKQTDLRNFTNMVIAISGWTKNEKTLNVGIYYPGLSDWVYKTWPSLSIRREKFASTSLKGKLIIAGGVLTAGRATTDSVECFDPNTLKWTSLSPLKTKRHSFKMATLNDCIYAVGGKNDNGTVKSIEKWDSSSNQWIEVTNMEIDINSSFLVSATSKSLCVSTMRYEDGINGVFAYNHQLRVGGWECKHNLYDPLTNTWTNNWLTTSDLVLGTGKVNVFSNEFFIVVSGPTITRYNHVIKSSESIVNNTMKDQCTNCVAFGGRIIAYGTNEFQEYDPFKNEWKTIPKFNNPDGGAVVLISNS